MQEEKIRLNKYMSEAGVCSRREADRLIEAGKVTVDGMKATVGMQIEEGQKVCLNGKPVEKDKKDKYIRRERYAGSMSRTFYVGESVTENDIHAKYENGILTLDVPKEEAKKVPEKRYISIEG